MNTTPELPALPEANQIDADLDTMRDVYMTTSQQAAFDRLATALRALRDAPDGWVPVAERLPKYETPVWLFDAATGSIWIGGRGECDDGWLWCNAYHNIWRSSHDNKWESDLQSDDDYNPTHWMPLPEPPALVPLDTTADPPA
jgi:hypothetical protein